MQKSTAHSKTGTIYHGTEKRQKNKIPSLTTFSKEELYEDNMKTKQESNALRDENKKNATKIVFLEQQLLTKDRLFEEMYRAAFQQAKYPFNQIAGGRGITAQS